MTFEIISTRRINKEIQFKKPIDIFNFVKGVKVLCLFFYQATFMLMLQTSYQK